jgi:hypothetical protein
MRQSLSDIWQLSQNAAEVLGRQERGGTAWPGSWLRVLGPLAHPYRHQVGTCAS